MSISDCPLASTAPPSPSILWAGKGRGREEEDMQRGVLSRNAGEWRNRGWVHHQGREASGEACSLRHQEVSGCPWVGSGGLKDQPHAQTRPETAVGPHHCLVSQLAAMGRLNRSPCEAVLLWPPHFKQCAVKGALVCHWNLEPSCLSQYLGT